MGSMRADPGRRSATGPRQTGPAQRQGRRPDPAGGSGGPPGDGDLLGARCRELASLGPAAYGAIPLSVQSGTASVRTFAGYQRTKQYQPMSISWAVPLTLDPDPNLFGGSGAARETAWTEALADGSRVYRVIGATEDAPVTWAIDPTLTPGLLPDGVDIEARLAAGHAGERRAARRPRPASPTLGPRGTARGCCLTPTPTSPPSPGAAAGESLMRTFVDARAAGG